MPFTFKLSRRLARIKARTVVATVFTVLACELPLALTEPKQPAPPAIRVVILPETFTVATSQTAPLVALGMTPTGDTATIAVRWSATNGSIMDTSGSGAIHYARYQPPTQVGNYLVVATGTPGESADTSTVTVTSIPVASVVVTPTVAGILVGATLQLTATARDSSGTPLGGRVVTWASSAPSVAAVSLTGLVTGAAAGTATITASSEGKTAAATVAVTNVPVASVSVSPVSASIAPGASQQFSAVTADSAGNPLTGRAVAWTSSDNAVATVSTSGLVRGVAAGSATIQATSEAKTGSASLTVTAAPPPPPTGLPVFPGAEGYGTTTPAGRGGAVIRVTNLNDAGPGSFRDAVQTAGPRTVIFDVSGTITLSRDIVISNAQLTDDPPDGTRDFLTVAGQTAPSPGITIRGGGLFIRASDILIQHIRFRVGDVNIPFPQTSGALDVYREARRVVADHLSLSWAIDQNASAFHSTTNITFSNCIISEGLLSPLHPEPGHSMGMLIGGVGSGQPQFISLIRNLFAHNWFRNPKAGSGGSRTVHVNNFIYDPGVREVLHFEGSNDAGAFPRIFSSLIGNAGRGGPRSDPPPATRIRIYGATNDSSQFYLSDNAFQGAVELDGNPSSILVGSPPFALPNPLTILPSGSVEAFIQANAGARPLDRDAVDIRVLNEVRNGTGGLIRSQADVGGWPTLAENRRVLAVPTNHAEVRPSGYTVLEEDILFPLARALQP